MVEDVDGWWFDVDVVDPFSESEQAINQSTLRKLAQPHKPKGIMPKFGNFETVLWFITILEQFGTI